MYGNFSKKSLQQVESMYDFTRCVKADGSAYGTGGQCRKGREEMKEKPGLRHLANAVARFLQRGSERDPEVDSAKNRAAIKALKALETNTNLTSEKSGGTAETAESPKYDNTPGSRKPMRARYDDSPEPSERLARIYKAQGFNAKPELVPTRSELERRKDVLTDSDGNPLILYRGVGSESFSRQFQGIGPNGGVHYPGSGISGNGTYAASAGAGSGKTGETVARETAIKYAGKGADPDRSVTAFALRSDANVVDFTRGTLKERQAQFENWQRGIYDSAIKKFGVWFADPGEAAAAMGIHAYRVPVSDTEDYWVILNRGAVIAAQNSQLSQP